MLPLLLRVPLLYFICCANTPVRHYPKFDFLFSIFINIFKMQLLILPMSVITAAFLIFCLFYFL